MVFSSRLDSNGLAIYTTVPFLFKISCSREWLDLNLHSVWYLLTHVCILHYTKKRLAEHLLSQEQLPWLLLLYNNTANILYVHAVR